MRFIADLHIHSRFSMATAKNLNFQNLYVAARKKGITLVGTGDFTHPSWFSEIREYLEPMESGLFRLRPDIQKEADRIIPGSCRGDVRFILQTEISSIYKKNGKTRKNHNLVFFSDLDATARFNARLDAIGNIKSDGRPILGLDARDLLEIVLETDENALFIPAHIWTPWFSLLGSKSGFDSMEECFEDLTPHIPAVETGLSSDPPMNWRISFLDGVRLVSNSDAHSLFTLGRNANIFDTELSFSSIRKALKTGDPKRFQGTIDMYPEEGKYHCDGHRNCGIRMMPRETIAAGKTCPSCGKPLTVGVLHRVETLSDRPENVKPMTALPFRHIIPLPEILSEILCVNPRSKKVEGHYHKILETLGPELEVLLALPEEALKLPGIPLVDEAIRRMRAEEVIIAPGYDGEYGRISLFQESEIDRLLGSRSLFGEEILRSRKRKNTSSGKRKKNKAPERGKNILTSTKLSEKKDSDQFSELNPEQMMAVSHEKSPLVIIAGPGTGKTRTITQRMAWLIREKETSPDRILGITFTNQAANEMRERIKRIVPNTRQLPNIGTFHAFGYQIIRETGNGTRSIMDSLERNAFVSSVAERLKKKGFDPKLKPAELLSGIIDAKQKLLGPDDDLSPVCDEDSILMFREGYRAYQHLVARENVLDFEDLIRVPVNLLENDDSLRKKFRSKYRYIFVDEFQDINFGQYRMLKAISGDGSGLCVIGDPDQAIYGFRGSDVRYFHLFRKDFPDAKVLKLEKNYRSTQTILDASAQLMKDHAFDEKSPAIYSGIEGIPEITVTRLPTEKAEAVHIGKTIEKMVGGTGFHSIDFGKAGSGETPDRAFSDFAVLYRTRAQGEIIAHVLSDAGIPHQIVDRNHFFDQDGIAEILALLKTASGIGTIHDLERLMKRKILSCGSTDVREIQNAYHKAGIPLKEWIESGNGKGIDREIRKIAQDDRFMKQKSLSEKIAFLADLPQIAPFFSENRNAGEHLSQLIRIAEPFEDRSLEFFGMVALQKDPDIRDIKAQKVTLMTIHAAKGLEFPVVFISGCEKGFIPFARPGTDDIDIEEERRLFYVAMTRAGEQLFFTHAATRIVYGKRVEREISPFVSDIEKKLLAFEKMKKHPVKNKNRQIQLSLFS